MSTNQTTNQTTKHTYRKISNFKKQNYENTIKDLASQIQQLKKELHIAEYCIEHKTIYDYYTKFFETISKRLPKHF